MSQFDRSELVSLADFYFKNKHYSDVLGCMKKVIKMGTPLNFQERILIFDSYYWLKDPFYKTLRASKGSKLTEQLSEEVQTKAKTAITRICDEAIELLDSYWIKRDDSNEAVAHYKCLKAIQYHTKVEVASGEDKEKKISKALEVYEEASKIANDHLNPAHPIRLYVAFGFSRFYYYQLHSADKALAISKEACEKGQHYLSELSKDLKYHGEKCLKLLSELIDNWS